MTLETQNLVMLADDLREAVLVWIEQNETDKPELLEALDIVQSIIKDLE